MLPPRGRLLVLCLTIAAAATAFLRPGPLLAIARLPPPFSSVFLTYENWKHPWLDARAAGAGRPANRLKLAYPMGLALGRDGTIYIGDRGGRFIWTIGKDRRTKALAGTGRRGTADPGPATQSHLGSPEGIAIDPRDGSLAVADSFNHVVLRVRGGQLERIAGTGESGFSGDGGPAVKAKLARPYDVSFNSKGELFLADYDNNRIRRIALDGTITTFAGGFERGYAGDGGPVGRALINGAWSVAVDRDNTVLIADSGNHVIRAVTGDGIIRTIAGRGRQGSDGDGGPALNAAFNEPQAILRLRDGRLLIDDEHNNAIRVLDGTGTVRHFMGGYPHAPNAAVTAPEFALSDPENFLELPDGSLLVAEGGRGRILRVSTDGRVEVFAGGGPD